MKKYLFWIISFSCIFSYNWGVAQTIPFPSNNVYEYGYMSNNISNADAEAEYNSWMTSYYVECSGSEARINDNGITVSEGIGYGMILTAYAGDKSKFEKLWNYYKNRRNGNGVMHWRYSGCGTNATGDNGATDAEVDVAMGLLIAFHQWPNGGYGTDLEALLNAIKTHEFMNCGDLIVQKPGDVWGGCDCTNPSYYAPGYYRAYAKYFEEKGDNSNANWWNKAADDSYIVLFRNQNSSTGLVSAWTNTSGTAGPCGGQATGGGGSGTYQYDACRTPWRIATDYLWWGAQDAKTFLTPLVSFVNTSIGGLANVVDGYNLNGTPTGQWHNTPFIGSFALAGMAVSQTDTDNYMRYFQEINGDNYFNSSLSVMYKFLATGNYWNPYSSGSGPAPTCSQVNLGSEKTLCGSGSAILNAEVIQGTDKTFTWFNGNTQVQSSTSNTYTANQAGTYRVVLDSAGVCSSEATVVVSASLPEINMPSIVYLSTNTILDAGIEGSGITFKWFRNDVEISGATSRTLAVTQIGTYKVEASATGCSMVSATTEVDQLPYINRTATPITIDGTIKNLPYPTREINSLLSGSIGEPNLAATWSGAWDNSNLYVFVNVIDNDLQNDSDANWWEDDGVEIFIDGDNSKNSSYGQNDFQWSFIWNSSTVNAGGNNPSNTTAGIQFAMTETSNGYYLEVSIPWTTIGITPSEGHTIGFDVAINDDDEGGSRNNKIAWNSTEDEGWRNPSYFGSVDLIGEAQVETITQELTLNSGWNLVSFYVIPENNAITNIMPNVAIVKTLDKYYLSNQESFLNSLTSIEPGKAYLVYANNQQNISITGTPATNEDVISNLIQGWNLMGAAWEDSKSLQDVFGNSLNNIQIIKDFDSFWQPGNIGNINSINGGKGYFVKKQ